MFSKSTAHVLRGFEQAATECNVSTFTSVVIIRFWMTYFTCILHFSATLFLYSTFYSIIYLIVTSYFTEYIRAEVTHFQNHSLDHQSDTFTRVLLVWGTLTWQNQNQSRAVLQDHLIKQPVAHRSVRGSKPWWFCSVHLAHLNCRSRIQVFYVLHVLLVVVLFRWHLFFLSVQQLVPGPQLSLWNLLQTTCSLFWI